MVFHLLPTITAAPSYDVSVELLERQLQRVSDAFNRKITTDPNAEMRRSCLNWHV
ncbi:MAG: hypothetical protein ACLU4N_01330 [Butyricimonas faecihominis]